MGPVQNLYYALGEVTYAISKADGAIEKKDKKKLNDILVEEFNKKSLGFDPAAIIFHILEKDRMDATIAYNWAIKEIKSNSHYVNEEMKAHFIHVLQRVTKAFPPLTTKEQFLIDSFINEVSSIKGVSVFTKE